MNTMHKTQNHESKPTGRKKQVMLLLTVLILAGLGTGSAAAEMSIEYSDVVGPGPFGPIVAMDGAKLVRSDNKLIISVRIPTPKPGSYNYPPGNDWNNAAIQGKPEAYSLWAFVFNYPEFCVTGGPGICTPADVRLGTPGVEGGAFNVAGHLVAGPVLQLNGSVTFDSIPFGGAPLMEPQTAEVHLAIAPHGALQPETMPNQIKTPIGNPGFWWLARF